jgi:hypothetical protein
MDHKINILKYENFKPSTVTAKASFSTTVNIELVAKFLIINNIFKDEKRVKLVSKSRDSIAFFGPEKTIVNVGYKEIRRGMRTGAMDNMVSVDVQYLNSNVHIKLSDKSITTVGTPSSEIGKGAMIIVAEHIFNLKELMDYSNSLDREFKKSCIVWLLSKLEKILPRHSKFIETVKIPKEKKKFINFLLCYLEDFDEKDEYEKKIYMLLDKYKISEGKMELENLSTFNSVFHTQTVEDEKFRLVLWKLAFFLNDHGLNVDFHNWKSDKVNVCMDISEEKVGINHANKEYKHRFTIRDNTKMKQCSPTCKEEAYGNYLGVAKLIKKFIEESKEDIEKYYLKDVKYTGRKLKSL